MSESKEFCKKTIDIYKKELIKKPNKAMFFVVNNLTPEHIKAALWLHDNYKMNMTSTNLANLIQNFEMGKLIATSTDKILFASAPIKPGEFHPTELAGFFKSKAYGIS